VPSIKLSTYASARAYGPWFQHWSRFRGYPTSVGSEGLGEIRLGASVIPVRPLAMTVSSEEEGRWSRPRLELTPRGDPRNDSVFRKGGTLEPTAFGANATRRSLSQAATAVAAAASVFYAAATAASVLRGSDSCVGVLRGSDSCVGVLRGSDSCVGVLCGSDSCDSVLCGSDSCDGVLRGSDSCDCVLRGSDSCDSVAVYAAAAATAAQPWLLVSQGRCECQ